MPIDPHIKSGSKCRGACGSDCPSSCQSEPDIKICVEDKSKKFHEYWKYTGVIKCGSAEFCRYHDQCFDDCAYGDSPMMCQQACNLDCTGKYKHSTAACLAWANGGGDFDSYILYSNDPVSDTGFQAGPCPATESCVPACQSGQKCCGGTCTDINSDLQNCGTCGNACTQGESCVSGSCSPSGGTTPSTTQDKYAVFLLTNIAGGSIWVGSEQEIQTKTVCSFPGGGLCKNDGTDALVQYVKKSQDFSSYDDAQAAYCAAPKSNVRSMALTGGTKANIYGGDYWIDTAPSCSSG